MGLRGVGVEKKTERGFYEKRRPTIEEIEFASVKASTANCNRCNLINILTKHLILSDMAL